MKQLRALLDAWRQEGFDDAYDCVRSAELMIVGERAFYDRLAYAPRVRTKLPWRRRLAYRLLDFRPNPPIGSEAPDG